MFNSSRVKRVLSSFRVDLLKLFSKLGISVRAALSKFHSLVEEKWPVVECSLRGAGNIFRALSMFRVLILVALLSILVLTVPDQTREIYLATAQATLQSENSSHVSYAYAMVILTTLCLWICGIHIIASRAGNSGSQNYVMHAVLAGLLSSVPACAFAMGLYLTSAHEEISAFPGELLLADSALATSFGDARRANNLLFWGSVLGAAVALVGGGFFALSAKSVLHPEVRRPFGYYVGASLIIGAVCLLILSIMCEPVAFPQHMGAIGVFLLFIIVMSLFGCTIAAFFDRYSIPSMSILLIWIMGLSALDLTDNHRVLGLKRNAPKHIDNIQTESPSEFVKWFESRNDRHSYGDKPYPVFIIAASGGGLYAAHHTATVLARLHDRCPNFSQHIFAISGVSGGGLGGAVFAGLAKQFAYNQAAALPCIYGELEVGQMERLANRFLANDFFSPLLAAGLFHDVGRKFYPSSASDYDRARALELTLEETWSREVSKESNIFTELFLDSWDYKEASPALILNTTDVDNGYRVIISPFYFASGFKRSASAILLHQYAGWLNSIPPLEGSDMDPSLYEELYFLFNSGAAIKDIKMSTAVALSARFPWITPAGTIIQEHGNFKGRLVDGGYFDNSGIETAIDLLEALNPYETTRTTKWNNSETAKGKEAELKTIRKNVLDSVKELIEDKDQKYAQDNGNQMSHVYVRLRNGEVRPVQFYLISISSDASINLTPYQGVGELLSPVRALLSTRERRGYLTQWRAAHTIPCWRDYPPYGCTEDRNISFFLNTSYFRFPLGWQLSDATRGFIERLSGDPANGQIGPIRNVKEFKSADANHIYAEIKEMDDRICRILSLIDINRAPAGHLLGVPYPKSCGEP